MGSSRWLFAWAVVAAAAVLFGSSSVPAMAQAVCAKTYILANGTEKTFSQCQSLPVQDAIISWDYIPGDNNTSDESASGGTLDLAFRSTLLTPGGWVGWGINPAVLDMVGSSVLIAFTDSSTGSAAVLPFKLNADLKGGNPLPLQSGPTDLDVIETAVHIDSDSLEITIYATLRLQPGQTNLNQVWNRGRTVTGQSPNQHDINGNDFLTSYGTLDVTTGTVTISGRSNQKLRNTHGFIQAISWGILFPLGIMSARYMRPFAIFDPLWFYAHIFFQVTGYILGVAGWAIGIKLMDNVNVKYKHRNIGISLFVLATLQVLALPFRPNKDHKLRKYWNVWHHTVGYCILILSIINIFEGFDLLMPDKSWKRAYVGVIVALGVVALIMEIFTWMIWWMKRTRTPERLENGDKHGNGHKENGLENGANHNNGFKNEVENP